MDRRCVANCLQACHCRDKRETYCLIQSLDRAARGDIENGLVFAGTKAGRAERIMTVAELMAELTQPISLNAPITAKSRIQASVVSRQE